MAEKTKEINLFLALIVLPAVLLESVWGLDYAGTTRTLDQHIVQIRRKLGRSGDLIETVRGTGYRLLA